MSSMQEQRYRGKIAGHHREDNRICIKIRFNEELFELVQTEALKREWSFSRMVRHLCEASIEGIE